MAGSSRFRRSWQSLADFAPVCTGYSTIQPRTQPMKILKYALPGQTNDDCGLCFLQGSCYIIVEYLSSELEKLSILFLIGEAKRWQ